MRPASSGPRVVSAAPGEARREVARSPRAAATPHARSPASSTPSCTTRGAAPAVAAAFAALLPACRVGREHEVPAVAVPEAWAEAGPGAIAAEAEERWWTRFGDPRLDALVERASAANLDLAAAAARVREARALRDEVAGGRAPAVDARAGYARVGPSDNTFQGAIAGAGGFEDYDDWSVGFDALWELDLFGRTGRAIEAAERGVEAAEADRRAALVAVRGEVARAYVELRGLQRQLALTRANLALQEDTLALTEVRFRGGFAPELDVARSSALVATTRAQIPSLDAQALAAVHRIGVLLGEPPEALRAELADAAPIPVAPAEVALGVPGDVLRRRPDVARAERELARAASLSAQATADLYPRFVIGASYGRQSLEGGDLFDAASEAWSVGPSLVAPLFRGGALRARVRAADARVDQAAAAYEAAVLEALREVEDALAAVRRERARLAELERAVESNRRAAELATDLQARGLVDFFEVLDAQRQQLAAETELARSETALSTQAVALYKALAGGWDGAE